jgi:hypothetical protein
MNRDDTRSTYYEFSGKLSDIARQLGFAGIAVIWLFQVDASGRVQLERTWWQALLFIVIALSSYFLQYAYQTAAWGTFNRHLEQRDMSESDDFEAPRWINWPALFLFWLKVLAVGVGYWWILSALTARVTVLA